MGTSAVKVGLFDLAGRAIRIERKAYPLYTPQPKWVEQDPQDWWEATAGALQETLADTDATTIAAVGLSGQTPGHVLVIADGTPLGRAIIWSDQRAGEEAAWLAEHIAPEQARQWTGNPFISDVTQPPARLLWLQRHRPQELARADAVVQPKDFVALRLTGQIATDHHSSYCLFNPQTGQYHEDYLHILGIAPSKMPPVLSPTAVVGNVTRQAAARTGLPAGTPVVAGTIDAWCDIIGCGATSPGQAVDVAGTSEVVALLADRPVPGEGVFGAWLLEKLYWVGGPMQGGGGSLLWWARNFHIQASPSAEQSPEVALEQLEAEASSSAPGAEGLLFLPYLRGERAPLWDEKARAAFVGLTDRHCHAHCTRALYEGIAFAMRDVLERSQAAVGLRAESLRVSGGASRSALWNQIKANVTGMPVQQMAVPDAGCLGAALLAAIGVQAYQGLAAAASAMVHPANVFSPQPDTVALYNELFESWRLLYPSLRPLFANLDRMRDRL